MFFSGGPFVNQLRLKGHPPYLKFEMKFEMKFDMTFEMKGSLIES